MSFANFVRLQGVLAVFLGIVGAAPAQAQETIKVGIIASFSGPFASSGAEIEGGIRAYLKQHGDTVAGKKIELISRDTTGPAPEIAKRLAQELVVRDKVDFLVGFGLTPEALAVAPIATRRNADDHHNAATSIITTKSPYIARVSFTINQVTAPMATWAAKTESSRSYAGFDCPRIDSGSAIQEDVYRRGRANCRLIARAAQKSGLLALHPAHQGCQA
jgi:branched-chain amino acid transport system substrate-binding protein